MLKLRSGIFAAALAGGLAAAAAPAAVLGPDAHACETPGRPAMLVKVTGLKSRGGLLRVQSYGGDPQRFFDKGTYLQRIEVRPPAAGPIELCLAVPREGVYAISVRHDINGSGNADLSDGGGFSGNPAYSLMDAMTKRKPDPAIVSVRVGAGVTVVPVTLKYLVGMSFRALKNGVS